MLNVLLLKMMKIQIYKMKIGGEDLKKQKNKIKTVWNRGWREKKQ